MPTGQPRTHGGSTHMRQRSASFSASSERIADRDFLEIARALHRILLAHRRALLRDRADGLLLRCCHGALRSGNQVARAVRPRRVPAATCPTAARHPPGCAAGSSPAIRSKRGLLRGPVPAEPGHQVVEIHLVTVEVGSVDAGELDAVADLHAAAAAHAGAVDHHRIEAHHACLILCARVASAQPFIMIGGPIATTSSMSACLRDRLRDAGGDQALRCRPSRRRCRRSARRRRRGTCLPRT